jgi:hypothetical protein
MKKQIALLGILFTLLFSACSSSETTSNVVEGTTWNLVQVSGSFTGSVSNFTRGTIKWTFNQSNGTLLVENINTNPNLTDILENGTYPYQRISNPEPGSCSEILMIDGMNMGCFSISNNQLTIDQAILNGYTLRLVP